MRGQLHRQLDATTRLVTTLGEEKERSNVAMSQVAELQTQLELAGKDTKLQKELESVQVCGVVGMVVVFCELTVWPGSCRRGSGSLIMNSKKQVPVKSTVRSRVCVCGGGSSHTTVMMGCCCACLCQVSDERRRAVRRLRRELWRLGHCGGSLTACMMSCETRNGNAMNCCSR